MNSAGTFEPFGEQVPYGDPYWYQGKPSPYYKETHHLYRQKIRAFVEKEIIPYATEWEEKRTHNNALSNLIYIEA